MWDKVKECVRHNLGLSVSSMIVLIGLFWFIGCESKVKSLTGDGLVTRSELLVEYNFTMDELEATMTTLQAKAELREGDLDRQDALKQKVTEFAITLSEGGTLNPVGVATNLLAVLGIGAAVDNRIKDRIIKTQKSALNA